MVKFHELLLLYFGNILYLKVIALVISVNLKRQILLLLFQYILFINNFFHFNIGGQIR